MLFRSNAARADESVDWEEFDVRRTYTLERLASSDANGLARFRATGVNVEVDPGYECRLVVREFERDSQRVLLGQVGDFRTRLVWADSYQIV